jgi:hypothetical protein
MELTTKVYLGDCSTQKFVDIVDWCNYKFGSYGIDWRLDWDKQMVLLSEKHAILFLLKWS